MPPPRPPKRQVRVGPFVVMDELAKGSTSRLFRARYRPTEGDQQLGLEYGAVVVLKVCRAGENPTEMERMTREAELLVMLDHPGIVRVLHRGMTSGRMWTAMEYIEGESLKTVFEALVSVGQRLQPQVALGLCSDLTEALAAVHSLTDPHGRGLGVVHRDLSPNNVLLDVRGQVRLIDLDRAVLGARETQGGVVGTPGYMSPEQARGESLNQASDVYVVGILLFELVTGVRMFPVESLPDMAIAEEHANATRAPWPEQCEVSTRVRAIVDQCLHPDPSMRPDSGASLFHMISPMVRNQDECRRRLSMAAQDLVRSNPDRPRPLFVS